MQNDVMVLYDTAVVVQADTTTLVLRYYCRYYARTRGGREAKFAVARI